MNNPFYALYKAITTTPEEMEKEQSEAVHKIHVKRTAVTKPGVTAKGGMEQMPGTGDDAGDNDEHY